MTAGAVAMSALDFALLYAARDWPVSPWALNKRPLTEHGINDATTDPDQIQEWWRKWPQALAAIATGERSGVVAVDIDNEPDGFLSLELLGVHVQPLTPTAHTPSSGYHMLFRWPGYYVKTVAGRLAPGIDIRGDGGSLLLPPGPGRKWDPILGPGTPLAPFPEWAVIPETGATSPGLNARNFADTSLSKYGEAALDSAVERVLHAPQGQQEQTLNGEAFALGTLAGAGGIPPALAIEALIWAGYKMPSYDARRPWQHGDIDKKVRAAVDAGMRQPRDLRRAS
jgi:Bifunctional DNA primase/polymerase, N-terminal